MKLIKKRKNAGFSLVELLVTILIISIVLGIGTYLVINTINNSKEKTKEITYENIKTSARLYAEENNSEITWEKQKNTEITCIPISYLIDQGYLKKSDVESVDYTSVIVTKDSDNRSILKEELDTKGICNETVVDIPTSKKYCLNTTYNGETQTLTKEPDEGYTFTDNKGIDAKKYIINAELKDDYRWEDGTHDTKTITCYIGTLIKYHGNGADESDIKIQKCIDDNCIVEKNTYTKLGHTFNSWNTTVAGTGMTITEGEKITLNEANLYAQWDLATYTISLDSEGASVAETKAIYLSYGQGIYLNDTLETKFSIGNNSIKIPTKKGYTFDGYYSRDNGTGTQLIDANGKRLEALTDTYATKDITIYAKWIPNTITITLKKDNNLWESSGIKINLSTSNTTDTATFSKIITNGSSVTFTGIPYKTTYYIWAGKNSNAKLTTQNTGLTINYPTVATNTVNYYTVTRKQGTGTTLTTRYDSTSSTTGTSFTTNTLTVLSGTKVWAQSSANTGYRLPKLERNNSGIQNKSFMTVTDTVTISSSATLMTYTISYKCNGSCTNLPSSQTKTHGTDLTLSSRIPIQEGYKFVGWGIETTSTEGTYEAGDTYTTNSDITLFAIWKTTLSNTIENLLGNANSSTLLPYTTSIGNKYEYRLWTNQTNPSDIVNLAIIGDNARTLNILQYQGANPDNYVDLNGELWRIISTINRVSSDMTLPTDIAPNVKKVKLIRAEPLDYYHWDTNGSVYWEESSLCSTLQAYYMKLDVTNTKECNARYSEKYGCNFTTIGLNDNARSLIAMGTWDDSIRGYTGNESYYKPADSLKQYFNNTSTVQSYVGLISPEDYVFAADVYKTNFYNDTLNNYNLYTDYNWLYDSITIPNRTIPTWTMNTLNINLKYITVISANGSINENGHIPTYGRLVTPVVYLDENVVVMSGQGTKSSPYQIAMGY